MEHKFTFSNTDLFKKYVEVASEEDIDKIITELFMQKKDKDKFACVFNNEIGLNVHANCNVFRTCEGCWRNSIIHAIAERRIAIMHLDSQED